MKPERVSELKQGLYILHWKEDEGGGFSLAAVGHDEKGRHWFAATNWTGPSSTDWSKVEEAELLYERTNSKPAMVKEIHYPDGKGGLTLTLSHETVPLMATEFVKFFKKMGGINYVEFTLMDGKNPELGPFTVTIQRMEGNTPGMVVAELKQRIAELEKKA